MPGRTGRATVRAMEKDFVRRAVVWLSGRERTWVYKVVASMHSRRGVPDILACVAGRMLALECKALGGKTSPSQDAELMRLREAGAVTGVVTTMEGVAALWALAFNPQPEAADA